MSDLVDRAMLDDNGAVFIPTDANDALYLYAMHGARPAGPERFPWRCPETMRFWASPDGDFPVNVQCTLVNLHAGDCRAEVSW